VRKEVVEGVRDPDLVRKQYEEHWSDILGLAQRIVVGEPHDLARALSLCLAADAPRHGKIRRLRGRRVAGILAGRALPPRVSRRCLRTMVRVAVTDLVAGYCLPGTKRVIELGSGWGINIFNLWLAGLPRELDYAALEYTETGREVTRLFAGTEPALRLTVHPFDYNKPDLSAFRSHDKTLVFTCHSIEQITHLGDALFEELLAIPGLDRVVHVEPVGWQLAAASPAGPLLGLLSRIVPPGLSLEIDVLRKTRSARYNADLIPRLRNLERAGRIRIERIEKNYVAANPLNPGAAIVWCRA
jgi:hypothetical protein